MYKAVLVSLMWVSWHATARAEKVGFRFSGMVVQPSTVFGHSLALGSPASGRFVYDLASVKTHDLDRGDGKGFRQRIFGGLALDVGGTTFRADDYLAAVFNDDPTSQGADILEVYFANGLSPPLEKPLIVDGVPHTMGLLNVSFRNPSGTSFSDWTLPNDLPPNSFPLPHFAFISDTTENPFDDALVMISSFSRLAVIDGDFDFDADVDGDDFLAWQRTLRSTTNLAADADGNNIVDSGDLIIWKARFGDGSLTIATVPEPPATVWTVLAMLAALAKSPQALLSQTRR